MFSPRPGSAACQNASHLLNLCVNRLRAKPAELTAKRPNGVNREKTRASEKARTRRDGRPAGFFLPGAAAASRVPRRDPLPLCVPAPGGAAQLIPGLAAPGRLPAPLREAGDKELASPPRGRHPKLTK